MKAIVTHSHHGAPDGQVHGVDFKPGDVIEGDLAAVGIRDKWAVPADEAGSGRRGGGKRGAPENKDLGAAAENKSAPLLETE